MSGMGRMQPIALSGRVPVKRKPRWKSGRARSGGLWPYSHGRLSPVPGARRHGSRYTRRAFCAPISPAALTAPASAQQTLDLGEVLEALVGGVGAVERRDLGPFDGQVSAAAQVAERFHQQVVGLQRIQRLG